MFGGAEQIELHPRNAVPASVFPTDAPVAASLLKPEGSMKSVAGLVGLSDVGEGVSPPGVPVSIAFDFE